LEELGSDDEWPTWDEKALISDVVEVVVQVNGKLRAKLGVSAEVLNDTKKLEELALADDNVKKFFNGEPKRVIVLPKIKLVNVVA
jgi:leucyl-tRNA synthetase